MNLKLFTVVLIVVAAICPNTWLLGQGSQNVSFLANANEHPANGYNDVWGYTAPDGREYALLGVKNGTGIIDITDTGNLTEIEFIPSANSTWKDLKTYQNYAYVVNESGGGMQIIDLSNLPVSASLAATYTGFATSHNLYIDEPNAMLYAEGGSGQPVRAISLTEPMNPVQVSSFGIECHDIYARNNIVYVSEGNSRSIGIYDLTIPSSPQFVNRFQIPSGGYVHNAWLSDDGNYLMTTEETPNKTVKYWDIRDLNNVRMTDFYLGPSRLAHNTHVMGNYAYISHYADGLKIVDVSDPNNIFEAGHYDETGATGGFAGAWGAFPFFPSGKILISDQSSGLWVFGFDTGALTDISLTITPDSPPVIVPSNGGSFNYTIQVTNNTGESRTVDVWTYAVRTGGGGTDALFLTRGVQLTPGQTKLFNNTQFVPPVDAGNFTYYAKVGIMANTPVAGDGFNLQISGQAPHRRRHKMSTGNVGEWPASLNNSALISGNDLSATEVISLESSYPNPFNPSTTISFNLAKATHVNLTIYNMLGQKVKTLIDESRVVGLQSVAWDATNNVGQVVSAGVYFYRLEAGGVVKTQKITLTK